MPFFAFLSLTLGCAFPELPASSSGAADRVLEIGNRPELWLAGNVTADASLGDFRGWVRAQVNPDYRNLISLAQAFQPVRARLNQEMLDGRVGRIDEIGCLESLLLAEHNRISPLREEPHEFRALVLRSSDSRKLRIHFRSGRLGGQAPDFTEIFQRRVPEDLREGWVPVVDMHNHPFRFAQPYGLGNLGAIPVPSTVDVRSMQSRYGNFPEELRPEQWVTNGFHTGKLRPEEYLVYDWRTNLARSVSQLEQRFLLQAGEGRIEKHLISGP